MVSNGHAGSHGSFANSPNLPAGATAPAAVTAKKPQAKPGKGAEDSWEMDADDLLPDESNNPPAAASSRPGSGLLGSHDNTAGGSNQQLPRSRLQNTTTARDHQPAPAASTSAASGHDDDEDEPSTGGYMPSFMSSGPRVGRSSAMGSGTGMGSGLGLSGGADTARSGLSGSGLSGTGMAGGPGAPRPRRDLTGGSGLGMGGSGMGAGAGGSGLSGGLGGGGGSTGNTPPLSPMPGSMSAMGAGARPGAMPKRDAQKSDEGSSSMPHSKPPLAGGPLSHLDRGKGWAHSHSKTQYKHNK